MIPPILRSHRIRPTSPISPTRLTAFTDGVVAIIITIMVLGLQIPAGHGLGALRGVAPEMVAYVLSFVFVAIYWNNHHHLLTSTQNISTGVMWANMHLLFWLSLMPIVTHWIGDDSNYRYPWPVAVYGMVAILCGLAYSILTFALRRANPPTVDAPRTAGDTQSKLSVALYTVGIVLALLHAPTGGIACYAAVAVMWLIPDSQLAAAAPE